MCRTAYRHVERGVGMVGLRHRGRPGQRDGSAGDIDRRPAHAVRPARRWAEQAVLATHKGATYVIWGGQRSRIDPTDRSVTFNLGLDPGVTYPIEISNALFDAMPSTEPLVLPAIPERDTITLVAGCLGGQRAGNAGLQRQVNGFYTLLPGGVQKITSFVADLLRTGGLAGLDNANAGCARQVDPHPGGRRARRRLLPVGQAGFR